MLIPSIDLRGGQVVQLIQGEQLAIASDDIFGWVRTFEGFPKVQLIDLDGAFGSGTAPRMYRCVVSDDRCSISCCTTNGSCVRRYISVPNVCLRS